MGGINSGRKPIFTPEQKKEIAASRLTVKQLSETYNIDSSVIYRIFQEERQRKRQCVPQ